MKINQLLSGIFLAIVLLMLADCTKEPSPAKVSSDGSIVSQDNYVKIGQVLEFAASKHPLTKASGEPDFDVAPYCGSSGDTLLYIVNYGDNDGWQILSSDARTPAVIAEGETGSFSLTEGSPAVQVWIDCTAQDIAAVRRASDSQLNFSKDEIAANKQVWGMRGNGDLEPITIDEGYWDYTVSSEVIDADSLAHMTPHWDQDAPYNAYCPLKSNGVERKPAGCVAVAAAEVLYYLHNHLGVPATMADSVTNNGIFVGASTTIWGLMNNEYSSTYADAEALMLGYVGQEVNMHYTDDYSWAIPANIRTQLFPQCGLTCNHGSYNETVVKNNLNNQMPVIVTATNLLVPTDFDIHCFVIDGYKKTYKKYTYYHYFVPDHPNSWIPTPEYEPYYTYSQTTPQITQIKINWGWWTQWKPDINGNGPYNDGWYSLTANWVVFENDSTSYTYNHNVSAIYDISIIDE